MNILACPNCNGTVEVDLSQDLGICPFCETKIQLNPKMKVEHTGQVSLQGLATVENLVKHAFLNVSMNENKRAIDSFQNALSIDPENAEALVGMMTVSTKQKSRFFYEKAIAASADFEKTEEHFLNQTTCHCFARAYAWASDYDRLCSLVSRYPECLPEVLLFVGRGRDIAQLLMQHVHSANEVFWMMGNNLDLEALESLLSMGLDPNAPGRKIPMLPHYEYSQGKPTGRSLLSGLFQPSVPFQNEYRLQGKKFASPLALVLGLYEGFEIDRDRGWMEAYEKLPLAEYLLQHGADPNKKVEVHYWHSTDDGSTWNHYPIKDCATTTEARGLLKRYYKKKKWRWLLGGSE